MSCVSACPDSAIFGIAQPDSVLEPAVAQFAAAESDPAGGDERARTLHAHDQVRRGAEPQGPRAGLFGIFVDPVHCKGCGECVEVCHALGATRCT